MRIASRLKNVSPSILASCSTGGAFISTLGSTTPSGGVYRFTECRKGHKSTVLLNRMNGSVVLWSIGLHGTDHPHEIGRCLNLLQACWRSPVQPGPVIAKLPALVPVVRLPGEANTFVHASSIGIRIVTAMRIGN